MRLLTAGDHTECRSSSSNCAAAGEAAVCAPALAIAPIAITGPVGCPAVEPPAGSTEAASTAVGPTRVRPAGRLAKTHTVPEMHCFRPCC
jgi:hypothetical protein